MAENKQEGVIMKKDTIYFQNLRYGRRQSQMGYLILCCLFVLIFLAHAQAAYAKVGLLDNPSDPVEGLGSGWASVHALGLIMARAIPIKPLSAGLNEVKVGLGYFEYKNDKSPEGSFPGSHQEDTGWAGSLSFTHGFSPHFGLCLISGFGDAKGDITMAPPGSTAMYTGESTHEARGIAASLIFDPFKDPEGFRLPLILGLSYSKASGQRGPILYTMEDEDNIRTGHQGSVLETYMWEKPGYFAGFAPQMNLGPFRGVLFAFRLQIFGEPDVYYEERDITTGEVASKKARPELFGAGGLGIELVYRPWNLSFSHIFATQSFSDLGEGEEISFTALTWSKAW